MMSMSDEEQATEVEKTAAKRRLRSGFRCSIDFFESVIERNAIRRDEDHDRFEM